MNAFVLLTGHHANIEKWRREQSIIRTYERRPDLLEQSELTEKERTWWGGGRGGGGWHGAKMMM